MRLEPGRLNGLLNDFGQDFVWRRGYACPCVNPQSGQPKRDCQSCDGRGRYWVAGVPGVAAAIGMDAAKKMAPFGLWDQGDFVMSLPSDSPLYEMGQLDRVAALNRTEPFSQNFVYGVNDALKFVPVSIDMAAWFDAQGNRVEGSVSYDPVQGLVWGASAPPAKTTYALTGRRMVEYFCFLDLTRDRPHHYGRKLPRKILMRRFDLWAN
jgi:hypothetical protein